MARGRRSRLGGRAAAAVAPLYPPPSSLSPFPARRPPHTQPGIFRRGGSGGLGSSPWRRLGVRRCFPPPRSRIRRAPASLSACSASPPGPLPAPAAPSLRQRLALTRNGGGAGRGAERSGEERGEEGERGRGRAALRLGGGGGASHIRAPRRGAGNGERGGAPTWRPRREGSTKWRPG